MSQTETATPELTDQRGPESHSHRSLTTDSPGSFTVPGLDAACAESVVVVLQDRLMALLDLSLTLKHIHWNVVGPGFIAVHKLADELVTDVRLMVDAAAERIATLGGSPNGLAGHLVTTRSWDDYSVNRATVDSHLGALDVAYAGVIRSHREAIGALTSCDPVSADLVTQQSGALEQQHWFVRAHLEDAFGNLVTQGARTELDAAARAAR